MHGSQSVEREETMAIKNRRIAQGATSRNRRHWCDPNGGNRPLLVGWLLCVTWWFAGPCFAQEATYPAPPSPEHAWLQENVGVWDAKIRMTTQDGKTADSGVETIKPLGKLWVTVTFEYPYDGKPTSAHGVLGYDPTAGKYVGSWYEAGSTHAAQLTGDYDAETRTLTYAMRTKDESGNATTMYVVEERIDTTHRTTQLQVANPDTDQRVTIMTIQYTKRS